MPYYEYYCAENGIVVEVRHAMSEELHTWSELCDRAGRDQGTTPPHASVERLMSLPVPTPSASSDRGLGAEPCGPGCACAMPE